MPSLVLCSYLLDSKRHAPSISSETARRCLQLQLFTITSISRELTLLEIFKPGKQSFKPESSSHLKWSDFPKFTSTHPFNIAQEKKDGDLFDAVPKVSPQGHGVSPLMTWVKGRIFGAFSALKRGFCPKKYPHWLITKGALHPKNFHHSPYKLRPSYLLVFSAHL